VFVIGIIVMVIVADPSLPAWGVHPAGERDCGGSDFGGYLLHGLDFNARRGKPRYLPGVTVPLDHRHVPEEWRPYWNAILDR
jgi:hypothetical protein